MEMEALKWALGILQVLVTAWCVHIYTQLGKAQEHANKLATDLSEHKLHTAETYMTKTELSRAFDSINRTLETLATTMNQRFDKMDEKLDRKADR